MLFITGALILSWLLLRLVEKKSLSVLGLSASPLHLFELAIGFFVSAFFCTLAVLILTAFSGGNWVVNKEFSLLNFFSGLWWMLRSVLTEELIFRGAILYILIQKTGVNKACLISAIAFGIYHWFSYSVFGDLVQMIFIFIMTGIGGLMFAFAFAKTKSMYLPVGLHLGWNLFNVVIFSNGPLGKQFLVAENGQQLNTVESLISYAFQTFSLPLVVWWYLKKYRSSKN